MNGLHQIEESVRARGEEIAGARPDWPCRKGCDQCCRRLASVPRVSRPEWERIVQALDMLPAVTAESLLRRIRESASATRPVVCPLLDTDSGACIMYAARPVACRAYGFYAERDYVLGCGRIESISKLWPEIVWGNHTALETRLRELGEARELPAWLAAAPDATSGA